MMFSKKRGLSVVWIMIIVLLILIILLEAGIIAYDSKRAKDSAKSKSSDLSAAAVNSVATQSIGVAGTSATGKSDKLTEAKAVAKNFLNARANRNLDDAKPYVTNDYLSSTSQDSFAGASSPSFGSYTIDSAAYVTAAGLYEVDATVHWMLQNEESGTSSWKIYLVDQNGKMLVNEVKMTDPQ